MTPLDIFGSVGVTIMIIPYFLNLRKLMSVDSLWYTGLMFIGSGSCSIYSFLSEIYPIAIVEGIWSLGSLSEFIRDGIVKYRYKNEKICLSKKSR